jgi:hypothetical protein
MSNFRFPGWLREDQIGWLYGYRKCEALKKCLDLIKNRIDELNAYQKSDVYTNYKGNKFMAGELTIIMSEILGVKKARFLGAWMPPMDISGELKGYPFDGFWCDEEVELIRKGNVFVSEGRGISLQTDSAKVLMKGHLICNARTGFPEGTYLK